MRPAEPPIASPEPHSAARERLRERSDSRVIEDAPVCELHRLQARWIELFPNKILEAFDGSLSGDWAQTGAELSAAFEEWAANQLREKAEMEPVPQEYLEGEEE